MAVRCLCVGASMLFALAAGCGGESLPTVPVTGTITHQGKPVEGATVTFSPQTSASTAAKSADSAKSASGTTDASGKYVLKTYLSSTSSPQGALPGEYLVTVSKQEIQALEMSPEDMQKKMMANKKGSLMGPPKHLLPAQYAGAKSGLTATVKAAGPNDFPFDLQGK